MKKLHTYIQQTRQGGGTQCAATDISRHGFWFCFTIFFHARVLTFTSGRGRGRGFALNQAFTPSVSKFGSFISALPVPSTTAAAASGFASLVSAAFGAPARYRGGNRRTACR